MLLSMMALVAGAPAWVTQQSHTTASLRGVSAVNAKVVWASGTQGTFLRTTDGGATWTAAQVPGAGELDFRDVEAFDERTAVLMSAGPSEKSRIYKTTDGGTQWSLLFTNPDAKGFFDSIAFWDSRHGILVGDAVDGRAAVFTTSDGGTTWKRQSTPAALSGEGSFAASGTCVVVRGSRHAWFVTGGTGAGRVFRSGNRGKSWQVSAAPLRNDSASAGIFSISFGAALKGVIVGGDYAKPAESKGNVAITTDGGKTWRAPKAGPAGFRSAVAWLPGRRVWIAAGTSGSDISEDGGETWTRFDDGAYNAVSFTRDGAGWAVGPQGRVARFQ